MASQTWDERVQGIVNGALVETLTEPAAWDAAATPKLYRKGKELVEGVEFTVSGGVITLTKPISAPCPLEIKDGASVVWKWRPDLGDLIGS